MAKVKLELEEETLVNLITKVIYDLKNIDPHIQNLQTQYSAEKDKPLAEQSPKILDELDFRITFNLQMKEVLQDIYQELREQINDPTSREIPQAPWLGSPDG
jgi:hypothetical protein